MSDLVGNPEDLFSQNEAQMSCAPALFDQSSLCARWVAKDLSILHAYSEDLSDGASRLIEDYAVCKAQIVQF